MALIVKALLNSSWDPISPPLPTSTCSPSSSPTSPPAPPTLQSPPSISPPPLSFPSYLFLAARFPTLSQPPTTSHQGRTIGKTTSPISPKSLSNTSSLSPPFPSPDLRSVYRLLPLMTNEKKKEKENSKHPPPGLSPKDLRMRE